MHFKRTVNAVGEKNCYSCEHFTPLWSRLESMTRSSSQLQYSLNLGGAGAILWLNLVLHRSMGPQQLKKIFSKLMESQDMFFFVIE